MKTIAASPYRRRLIAAIHAAATKRGIDDDERRDIIAQISGRRSAKDCTDAQLGLVLDRLNGVTGARPFRASDRPEVRKIHALWGELRRRGALTSPTKDALRAFCARMAGLGDDAATDPEFLTVAQARIVIEALKAWIERTLKNA